jgi:hypothetical protein
VAPRAIARTDFDVDMMLAAGETAIIGAVDNPEERTEIRYNAFRHDPPMEFGDPYIPKSVLGDHYPDRLLFVVRWIN